MSSKVDAKERIQTIGVAVRDEFQANRRVMGFSEYVALFQGGAVRHTRSAARYLRDVLDHYGTTQVRTPAGPARRFRVFDGSIGTNASEGPDRGQVRLVGQEEVQNHFYRVLSNFVREGRANKLVLLHGPNGSAKSTFLECLGRALEDYSTLDEGALYRFNWVFPSEKYSRSGIGFGGNDSADKSGETFAFLGDDLVDARLRCELRDHPLLLIPAERRRQILSELIGDGPISDYVWYGELCVRCKQIYEALLTSYQGDYLKVLRHVQVERFYMSHRYREAIVEVEPQLSVDAYTRQITADRSLGALPAALQCLDLHEVGGALVESNRGMIVYSDLLKRPLEAYKYLLGTVEQARVGLEGGLLYLDSVLVASSNETHLAVFKEIPEFASFKARIELIRVPYLLDYEVEREIYGDQIFPTSVGKHIAPHSTDLAALWAVLTRMRKPLAEKYSKTLSELVQRLHPLHKADLYAKGEIPDGVTGEALVELRSGIAEIYRESETYPNYEGRTGASPREIKTVLLNAAQSGEHSCLSPAAVFEQLDELCKNVTVYGFLKQEPLPGGYHENRKFVEIVHDRYLSIVEDEVRSSMGLVEDQQHLDLFARYVQNVNQWVKGERIKNPVTGTDEDPDDEVMTEVEKIIGVGPKRDDFRAEVIATVGAWFVDHPGQKPNFGTIFPQHIGKLRDSYFTKQRKVIEKGLEELLLHASDDDSRVSPEGRAQAKKTMKTLNERYGYCDGCGIEAIRLLRKGRYS